MVDNVIYVVEWHSKYDCEKKNDAKIMSNIVFSVIEECMSSRNSRNKKYQTKSIVVFRGRNSPLVIA